MSLALRVLLLAALLPAACGLQELAARRLVGAAPVRRMQMLSWSAAVAAMLASASAVAGTSFALVAAAGLGWSLVVLARVDLAVFRLPDVITLPLIVAGVVLGWLDSIDVGLARGLGAVVGYAVLGGLAWGYRRLRGRDGLGLGDAKLLAAGGAWLGWTQLAPVVLIACACALAYVAVTAMLTRGWASGRRIAFGAPLAAAIWLAFLATARTAGT